MAESIVIHFRSATRAEIFAFLRTGSDEARASAEFFFPNAPRYVLLLSDYSDRTSESEKDECRKKLEPLLGWIPTFSLYVELRHSMQNIACDAATTIVRDLTKTHDLAVDDGSRLWTKAEITAASTTEFLKTYRHHSYLPPRRIRFAKLAAATGVALVALRVALGVKLLWPGFGLLLIASALVTTVKRCHHCRKQVTNFGYTLPTYCGQCWTPYSANQGPG